MELKTNYNINDEVWFIHGDKPECLSSKVVDIHVAVVGEEQLDKNKGNYIVKETQIKYAVLDGKGTRVWKENVFPSKQDLLNSL